MAMDIIYLHNKLLYIVLYNLKKQKKKISNGESKSLKDMKIDSTNLQCNAKVC